MPSQGSDELAALNRALQSLTDLKIFLQAVREELLGLQRHARDFVLELDRDGKLAGISFRPPLLSKHLGDAKSFLSIELRSHCEQLPEHVKGPWDRYRKADDALATPPTRIIERLDALKGAPWLAWVRRNCLDSILAWPGETGHQFALGTVKVAGNVNELLEEVQKREPFSTWEGYERLLAEYGRDLYAIRDAALASALPPAPSIEAADSEARKPRKSRRPDRATEARDKWLYEQCCNGIPYDTIAIRLRKKSKTWERIGSKQGIRAAAVRYAKRSGLPEIPPRQEL